MLNHWLQYYSKDSLKPEFSESGFKTEALYSDVAGRAFNLESDRGQEIMNKHCPCSGKTKEKDTTRDMR